VVGGGWWVVGGGWCVVRGGWWGSSRRCGAHLDRRRRLACRRLLRRLLWRWHRRRRRRRRFHALRCALRRLHALRRRRRRLRCCGAGAVGGRRHRAEADGFALAAQLGARDLESPGEQAGVPGDGLGRRDRLAAQDEACRVDGGDIGGLVWRRLARAAEAVAGRPVGRPLSLRVSSRPEPPRAAQSRPGPPGAPWGRRARAPRMPVAEDARHGCRARALPRRHTKAPL
jgi:hypothetical protein